MNPKKILPIPAVLLDGYIESIHEAGTNPPTYKMLSETLKSIGLPAEWALACLPDELQKRAIALDLDAIQECNRLLPGWVLTVPEIIEKLGECQRQQTYSDPNGKAEDFIIKATLPRSIGAINRNSKPLINFTGYGLYHMHIYNDAKYLCAILDHEKDSIQAELLGRVEKVINKLIFLSEHNDFNEQYGKAKDILKSRKNEGLKNQFTTNKKILQCISCRNQYTPQRLAFIIMGEAFGYHPDTIKKEISKMDFNGNGSVLDDQKYLDSLASIFCSYMQ